MNIKSVLILGAKSDIALSLAHRFGSSGCAIQLAARNKGELERDKSDLEIRYNVKVSLHEFDVLKIRDHQMLIKSLNPFPDVVICAIGFMSDQQTNEKGHNFSRQVFRTNFEGPSLILLKLAQEFVARGIPGCLVGISSVAGERGRKKNFIYGSSKAGFSTFLSGLRNKLYKEDIHVLTVLPGFVYTKMTEGMSLPKSLTVNPQYVARKVFKGVVKKKNVIYVSNLWRFIMIIIRIIPESIFKKLSI